MTLVLLIAAIAIPFLLCAAVLTVAYLLDRRDLRHQAPDVSEGATFVAYHARRCQEIRAAIDAMGDDAQHLFPPARNGR